MNLVPGSIWAWHASFSIGFDQLYASPSAVPCDYPYQTFVIFLLGDYPSLGALLDPSVCRPVAFRGYP